MFENEFGFGFVTNTFGDRYLYEVNGTAFNRVGSEALYRKHFGEALQRPNQLYLILGTDSGLLPAYIAKSGVAEGSYYIFIELPQILERIRAVIPPEGFHRKILVTTADQWLERAKEIQFQNFIYLDSMQFHRSLGAEDVHLEEYQELTTGFQEELERIKWVLTADLGAEVFNVRQLENLPENRLSAAHLKDRFTGKTAVILGGGPTLDETVPWLLENRDRIAVIAVSRIARRLLDVGLQPDVIVSIDPHPVSFDVSKEMLLLWERAVFVHMHHVVSSLAGQWRGRSLFLGQRLYWRSPLNDDVLLSLGPTVTNSAISLAVEMGFSQVLLAGVDLCFNRAGYTHAQGSNEAQVGPQLGQGQFWVETNGGWMAETTVDFHLAISQLAWQGQESRRRGCRLVNLGLGAARVDDVEYAAPEDVFFDPLPKPAFDMILEHLPPDGREERLAYYGRALAELERAAGAFRKIRNLAVAGLSANDAFFGRKGQKKGNPRYKLRMDRIEKELKSGFPDFLPLVQKFGIRDFLKMTQGDQDQEWSEKDVERLGRIYYEAFRDSAERLLRMVESARERLLSRREEEGDDPDFPLLLKQWQKDAQPGRALVWKTRNPGKILPPEVATRMGELEETFRTVLDDKETLHMKRTSIWSQLGRVRGKMRLMFRRGEWHHLEQIVESLAALEGPEAAALCHLGRGYLAEAEGKTDAALEHYQVLIDEQGEEGGELSGSILEEALRRILSIALDRSDAEYALLAADCLARISPVYLPYYADLLRLLGERDAALDAYASYLEKVPDDGVVMMKLGRYYLELGVEEGARLMFAAVLEKDPRNQAAAALLSELDATACNQ